jgi:ADP-ribose pyrophosphatase YjhB (NUDIX family)
MYKVEPNYCLSCGKPLDLRKIDETERRACPNCPFVFWGDYSIGVGALVIKDNKVLLVKRAHDPGKGYWTNPGGYIEQFESIEETIVREVEEESGIKAAVKGIVAVRDQPRHIHNVYIAFSMEYIDGDPRPDGVESDEAGFFSLEEMETMNVASFTKWLVQIAHHRQSDGLLKDDELIEQLNGHGHFRIP